MCDVTCVGKLETDSMPDPPINRSDSAWLDCRSGRDKDACTKLYILFTGTRSCLFQELQFPTLMSWARKAPVLIQIIEVIHSARVEPLQSISENSEQRVFSCRGVFGGTTTWWRVFRELTGLYCIH